MVMEQTIMFSTTSSSTHPSQSEDALTIGSVRSNSNYGLGVALSQGLSGQFGDYLYFTFSPSCIRPGVHFVDITGDGR